MYDKMSLKNSTHSIHILTFAKMATKKSQTNMTYLIPLTHLTYTLLIHTRF